MDEKTELELAYENLMVGVKEMNSALKEATEMSKKLIETLEKQRDINVTIKCDGCD